MINRIKSLLLAESQPEPAKVAHHGHEEIQLAAAALLVEVAWQDDTFDDVERAGIGDVLMRRFGLNAEEAETLVVAAADVVADSVHLHGFARAVRDHFDHDERVEMVEMLWEVVYADGVLHDHEASLMRRIGGLIYVSDQERGAARKRVLARRQNGPSPEEV
jgi:uncharacterized tellurite resistance protein B-like protein